MLGNMLIKIKKSARVRRVHNPSRSLPRDEPGPRAHWRGERRQHTVARQWARACGGVRMAAAQHARSRSHSNRVDAPMNRPMAVLTRIGGSLRNR